MRALQISPSALASLTEEVRKGFEQRLVKFLRTHAPGFRREAEEVWRGYERSARLAGLVAEQEVILYVYGCHVLGDDIALHEDEFLKQVGEIADLEHRLALIEERVLAYALAREMADGP